MTLIQTIMNKVKEMGSGNREPEEPPKPMPRDKALESMEREYYFYQMQERKKKLKKALAEHKIAQFRKHMFGNGDEEGHHVLGKTPPQNQGVGILKDSCSINRPDFSICNNRGPPQRVRRVRR